MSSYKRGTVWFMAMPETDGRLMKGSFPAVIVSNNLNNTYSDIVTVVPIAREPDGRPMHPIVHFKGEEVMARTEHIITVNKYTLERCAGKLSGRDMDTLYDGLMTQLGRDYRGE